MRTTVTIDTDVAESLQSFAHRHGLSFKKALNELLRRGLRAQLEPAQRERFQVEPHRGGFRPGVDPARLNQLLDELEAHDFRRESQS